MHAVLLRSWSLLFGTAMIMAAQGLTVSLVGVRGELEGFGELILGLVMSGYFLGSAVGTMLAPAMVRRVGHVRVYAAFASGASASVVLIPVFADPYVWCALRIANGACMAAVYVVSESWLNGIYTNRERGKVLGLYLLAQLVGSIAGQAFFAVGDPREYDLFIFGTVLMSLAFTPLLLLESPTPAYATTKPMSFRELYRVSPLAFTGMIIMGLIYGTLFSMGAVYGARVGLSVGEIAALVAAIYGGAAILQYPAGWFSDRFGRRPVVLVFSNIAAVLSIGAIAIGPEGWTLFALAGLIGAFASPIYSILGAHANDFLEPDRMAAATARLIFLTMVSSVAGPPLTGACMMLMGPDGFFAVVAAAAAALGVYVVYRSLRRPAPRPDSGTGFSPMPRRGSAMGAEIYAEALQDSNSGR